MANEISLTASLTAYKPAIMSSALSRAVSGFLATMQGLFIVEGSVSIATVATAFPLGQVTQPHWAFFLNLDPTNYVQLMNGAAGAVFARLLAGEPAFVPLDPGCVPYGKANTAAVQVEFFILSL